MLHQDWFFKNFLKNPSFKKFLKMSEAIDFQNKKDGNDTLILYLKIYRTFELSYLIEKKGYHQNLLIVKGRKKLKKIKVDLREKLMFF